MERIDPFLRRHLREKRVRLVRADLCSDQPQARRYPVDVGIYP